MPAPSKTAAAKKRSTAKPAKKALTPAEQNVLDALKDNKTVAEIALSRSVTEQSVYNHISKIRAKGHDVPERNNGADAQAASPAPQVTDNGLARDDDVDLLNVLSAQVAESTTALVDGLRERRAQIMQEVTEKQQLIIDTEMKINELEARAKSVDDRLDRAGDVAEAIKPLVVSR